MKNYILLLAVILSLSTAFVSCSKDDDKEDNNPSTEATFVRLWDISAANARGEIRFNNDNTFELKVQPKNETIKAENYKGVYSIDGEFIYLAAENFKRDYRIITFEKDLIVLNNYVNGKPNGGSAMYPFTNYPYIMTLRPLIK
ncbi:MAG: hypothetical protein RL662_290 [Bacteroidota bacterium]|jgi:hypothetical protein